MSFPHYSSALHVLRMSTLHRGTDNQAQFGSFSRMLRTVPLSHCWYQTRQVMRVTCFIFLSCFPDTKLSCTTECLPGTSIKYLILQNQKGYLIDVETEVRRLQRLSSIPQLDAGLDKILIPLPHPVSFLRSSPSGPPINRLTTQGSFSKETILVYMYLNPACGTLDEKSCSGAK